MSSQFPSQLKQKIDEWKKWDKNERTLKELDDLIQQNNVEELSKRLLDRLAFGTAGLRGQMRMGYNAMNDLVILQTAQGLMKYLEETNRKLLQTNGIIFGFDGRHNSKRFAEISASIFLHHKYPVYLFSDVVPTPFVAYGVRLWKCMAGVMVTASHNPKQDNGYKVYWTNGVQIISPIDQEIQQKILENLEPWPKSWDTSILKRSTLCINPLHETFTCYINDIGSGVSDYHREINCRMNLKLTYTAMHGVGFRYAWELLRAVGLQNIVPVEEQKYPHPDFPTVVFPNPEEGEDCLKLSFKTADENHSKVILANDPDADRLAVAEKNEATQTWTIFTGNEIGALLGWWMLQCFLLKHSRNCLGNCYMLSSAVSSKILKSMADAEGFNFEETLTGFKWLGNRTYQLMKERKVVLFVFEEAIGFMCDHHVLDKDGISAALHMATLASYLYQRKKTLSQKLNEIFDKYGYHVSSNSYFICHEAPIIKRIFERLRNFDGPNTYPRRICGGKYKVKAVRDLTTGYDEWQPDKKAILPVSSSSQMITFWFENGFVATLRTSGTEPKIKYYTEMCAPPSEKNRDLIKKKLGDMVEGLIEEFLQPKQNNLKSK